MTDIAQRLLDQITVNDHARGCAGRCYSCECGYDKSTEELMAEAAADIERLRRTLRELEFYENDPWARNKIRVALSSTERGPGASTLTPADGKTTDA